MIQFQISNWAAWAPGLHDQSSWLAYLAAPHTPTGDETPALSEMPVMLRRRVGHLGKMALQVAYRSSEKDAQCPVIFASRYGDMAQSVEQLSQLALSNAVSPTAFSMSVHNAISALFSIARKDTGSYTAIAAGQETTEAAFTEALALLADGAASVLLVYYDEPLPQPHHIFADTPEFPHAFACLLVKAEQGISLCSKACGQSQEKDDLPGSIAVLRFLLSNQPEYLHTVGPRTWVWQRNA
ncbi:beta-ketoacyl synthase chain length factor [Iodobacter sp. LRB]|uniref:beta-ketoacyl synthase chain length factor n=1 Tax=unclassified Iodobacter TaxID=235634 RepID=UPI001C558831|nr:beta-ketoacyl synthase chain length factor [Iodobacter sp. BJB302]